MHVLQWNVYLSTNVSGFILGWNDKYPRTLVGKPTLSKVWVALPKYVMWKVRTMKIYAIFENKMILVMLHLYPVHLHMCPREREAIFFD